MPLTPFYLFLLIAAGVLLLSGRTGRMGWVGLVPLGLGIAATTVRLGNGLSDLALRAAETGAPLGFLRINTGLILLGLGLVAIAAIIPFVREPGAVASWLALLLVLGGGAPIGAALVPLLGYLGWVATLGSAAAIGVGAIALYLLGRLLRIGRAVGWLDLHLLERNPPTLTPAVDASFDIIWVAGFVVSGVIMLVTPSLRAFSLATVVAGTVSHVLLRRFGGGTPVPVAALFTLALVPAYQLLAAISGEPAPRMETLSGAPLSIAAENRVVPWVALAAWGLAGLWPLHGLILPLAAPLAGILLIRLGAHAAPSGMAHWAPVFMPLALLGVGHAAATMGHRTLRLHRLIELLVGLALLGVFAGGDGIAGAAWLLVASAILPWSWLLGALPSLPWGLGRLLWLPLVGAALLIVTAGLAVQVTYTVLAVGGIAVALWVSPTPE